ncbi:MAG: 16S rRNA (guanine(527)-N(7))-methyltransferase RsmG [Alphaproteobacteria bacterium]|nr:16S rRNA (guanine(527)-N(7))-methyltransferase RsmG [Alphaproteobacteria bacterium]
MTGEKQDFIERYAVPRETIHNLSTYETILKDWNNKFNLIAESTLPHIWSRHFADSAQLLLHIPENAKTLADMGSGAGFPGLVLAVMRPSLQITLIESIGKKADFLRAVTDAFKPANVTVRRERVENIKDLKADIVTARAMKALPELLKYAHRLLAKDGICVFPKGKNAPEELTEAKKNWTFKAETHPSLTSAEGRILVLSDLSWKARRKG